MVKKFFVAMVLMVMSLTGLAIARPTSQQTNYWHQQMSQTQRNRAIVDRAEQQANTCYNLSCKDWVRMIVRSASSNVVNIPSNASDYQWGSSPDVIAYPVYPTSGFKAGMIIQMRWENQSKPGVYPHTAIIKSVSSSSMKWLDCNWKGDGQALVHTVTFSDFRTAVGNFYTVYEIR